MPRTSAYTRAAARLAELASPARADLHVHTTASDGDYTPSQVVAQARLAKVRAVAITDHDTIAGIEEARTAAEGHLELISGVEISARFNETEVHLLGYDIRTNHAELNATLAAICESRRERFHDFVTLLHNRGLRLPEDRVRIVASSACSLGRRHVADLLVTCGHARTRTEAFHRVINRMAAAVRPKALLAIEEAIRLIHSADGVSALAHPPPDLTDEHYARLRAAGLVAVEAVYPWGRTSTCKRLREVAARHGFAVSGGSDCHGPEPAHRRIGSYGITLNELAVLRARARG